jgi:hypothetical protein
MSDYMKPKQTGIRDVLSNAQMNGRVMNPPRMAQLGGLSSVHKKGAMKKNALTIRKPGDTK